MNAVGANTENSGTSYAKVMDLAKGGMGTVELVLRQEGAFTRLYARKRPRTDISTDESSRQMFVEEARIAGLLRHANVVSVLDVGKDDEGPYLLMDFVDGMALGQIVRATLKAGDLLPVAVCLDIARQTAKGLAAAHELVGNDGKELNLVHRDVSPQNILVGFDGVVRVTDFGVAKALGRQLETQDHSLKGKIGYMSPEQLRFEPVDHRSDLFAFGVVLAELLTGTRLYKAASMHEAASMIVHEPPPDLTEARADLPPKLVELLFALLAKSPDARPKSARIVLARIGELLEELEAEHGRVDLEQFMREHFEPHQTQARRGREKAIRVLSQPEVSPVEKGTFSSPFPWGLALGAAALILTAVGLGVGLSSAGSTPDVPIPGEPVAVSNDSSEDPSVGSTIEAEAPPALPDPPVEPMGRLRSGSLPADSARDNRNAAANVRANARMNTPRASEMGRTRVPSGMTKAAGDYWDWP